MHLRVNPKLRNCLALMGVGIALVASAALLRLVLAPQLLRLPMLHDEVRLDASARTRERADDEWIERRLVARRIDQTLLLSDGHAVIQGDVHWTTPDGETVFERVGVYGVDRHTRANLALYGNVERSGHYAFPLHVQRHSYRHWDPQFAGARDVHYVADERRNDLDVLRFDFDARDLDETASYTRLPDVPHRFEAHTNARGSLWVEPASGHVIDYEEHGRSYFVEPITGQALADFHRWEARFNAATRERRAQQARATQRRALLLESVLPALALLSGATLMGVSLRLHQSRRRARVRTR